MIKMTQWMKHVMAAGAAGCLLLLGGCATPPAPSAAALAPVNPDYLIGPGDAVNIIVWRNPEVSMSVPVRPDGKITTPLVEDLPAAGKTSTQLARDIEPADPRQMNVDDGPFNLPFLAKRDELLAGPETDGIDFMRLEKTNKRSPYILIVIHNDAKFWVNRLGHGTHSTA